jgi:lysozyme family protein
VGTKEIIDQVILNEGGATATNNPADRGGRTQFGISERANPQAWLDGKVTEDEARAIYEQKYLKGPGFDQIHDSRLQAQLVDYGVVSGPFVAIQKLQDALGLTTDGVLGPHTLAAANANPRANQALVKARVMMIARIVQKNPSQVQFLAGWLARALEFL